MATSRDISDGTGSMNRREPRSKHSGSSRISVFGRDLPIVVVLAVLGLPAAGAFLGATGGVGATSTAPTVMAEFGAMIGAVGSNVQALLAQIGTGPSLVVMSAIILVTEKIIT